MRLFPKGFTRGMKKVGGDFLVGVWEGMGPDIRPSKKKESKKDSQRRKESRE